MDLTVDGYIVFDVPATVQSKQANYNFIDPHDGKSIRQAFTESYELPCLLPPGRRALLASHETVHIPRKRIGLICLRSTWARLGFMSPTTIADAGFHGQLTMEVYNVAQRAILIRPGDIIWSMTFLITKRLRVYRGRYQMQKGITLPKALLPEVSSESLLGQVRGSAKCYSTGFRGAV